MSQMTSLPKDLWKHHIAKHLSPFDHAYLRATSRFFRECVVDSAEKKKLRKSTTTKILYQAARWGHRERLRSINAYDKDILETILYGAARGGHRDIVELIIRSCGNADMRILGLRGAARGGHRDIVEWMMRDADSNLELNMALYDAARGGHRNLVDLLIAKGANNWDYVLYGAAYGGHRGIVDLMIARCASRYDAKGANNLNWGLYNAVVGGHCEIVEFLFAKCPTDINHWNYCLHAAACSNRPATAKLLQELIHTRTKNDLAI